MQTDYEYMALSLANLSGLPVRLYKNEKFVKLYHHNKFKPDLAILEEKKIFKNTSLISYYMTDSFLFYGLFRSLKDPICLVFGPVSPIQLDRLAINQILRSIGEPQSRYTELHNYLMAMPSYPLANFLQILCTINYFINGEKIDVSDLLLDEHIEILFSNDRVINDTQSSVKTAHNTLELEQLLLSSVEYGRVHEIEELFKTPPAGRAGTMAQDALRQEKNLFICTVTLVTRAAIKGGLDHETAFALSDLYLQKSEMMTEYIEVSKLQAQMILDFTKRVANVDIHNKTSKLMRIAKDYILNHINEPITTAALAKELGLNRTYLCKLFQDEVSMTVNNYITNIKINEAKYLLEVTQKTLSEISEYLGFSSQSYFQNVFKKEVNMTPSEYRKSKEL